MLRQLRSPKIKTVLWIGLAIFIIPSFVVFYGWGSGGSNNNSLGLDTAATLELKNVGKVEVNKRLYEEAKRQLRYTTRQYLTNEMNDQSNADNQIIDYISSDRFAIMDEAISLALLSDFATEQGIKQDVSGPLNDLKKNIPSENQRQQFVQRLAQQNMSIGQYLEEVSRGEFLGLAQQTMSLKSRITVYDAWLDYMFNNEKFIADVAHFTTSDYISKITDDTTATAEWFENNKKKFSIPDEVEYEYILLRKNDLRKNIVPTDDEITSYYTNNKEDFRTPRLAKVRQIMLNVDPSTTAENKAEMTKKLEDLRDLCAKGSDFAQLATSNSQQKVFPPRDTKIEDNPSTAGGYLGYISEQIAKSMYGDDWTSAVYSMPATGGLTGVIETRQGLVLAKVEEVKDGIIQDLDKVSTTVKNRVIDQKIDDVFTEEVAKLKEQTKKLSTLDSIANATSMTIATTEKMRKNSNYIPTIGYLGELKEAISDLTKGGRSDLLADNDRALVIQIKEEYPEHLPTFEEVRPEAERKWKEFRASELAKQDAEKVLAKATTPEAFDAAAVECGTTVTKTLEFERSEVFSGLGGTIKDFDGLTRSFKQGQVYLDAIDDGTGNIQSYVVWKIAESKQPTRAEFAKELPLTFRKLSNEKSAIIMRELLRDRRSALDKEGKIIINEEYR